MLTDTKRSADARRSSAASRTRTSAPSASACRARCRSSTVKLVEFILRMGLAVGCTIAPRSVFARKNYFYPDLPKGYQISQYEEPICTGGLVDIDLEDGATEADRPHAHPHGGGRRQVHPRRRRRDARRCEPVRRPADRDRQRARASALPARPTPYLSRIRQLVTYLGICDGNMEEGSLRCDANVSVRLEGTRALRHENGSEEHELLPQRGAGAGL